MSGKNTGGPAFPTNADNVQSTDGMTLRDWFAGMAMQGLAANAGNGFNEAYSSGHIGEVLSGATRLSYALADEMLKAREG